MAFPKKILEEYRILVVDDDKVSLRLASSLLNGAGFKNVVCLESPKRALRKIEVVDFDIAVVDIHMPEMNGIQFIKELRTYKRFEKMPVLILSSETKKEVISKLVRLGISDYCLKPIDKKVFYAKLKAIIEKREEEKRIEQELEELKKK